MTEPRFSPAESTRGRHDIPIVLRGNAGGPRTFWVVCAGEAASAELEGYTDRDEPPRRDGSHRDELPSGPAKISNAQNHSLPPALG